MGVDCVTGIIPTLGLGFLGSQSRCLLHLQGRSFPVLPWDLGCFLVQPTLFKDSLDPFVLIFRHGLLSLRLEPFIFTDGPVHFIQPMWVHDLLSSNRDSPLALGLLRLLSFCSSRLMIHRWGLGSRLVGSLGGNLGGSLRLRDLDFLGYSAGQGHDAGNWLVFLKM